MPWNARSVNVILQRKAAVSDCDDDDFVLFQYSICLIMDGFIYWHEHY